jgi:hypothetical protein
VHTNKAARLGLRGHGAMPFDYCALRDDVASTEPVMFAYVLDLTSPPNAKPCGQKFWNASPPSRP